VLDYPILYGKLVFGIELNFVNSLTRLLCDVVTVIFDFKLQNLGRKILSILLLFLLNKQQIS